jgi:uncharacterized protein
MTAGGSIRTRAPADRASADGAAPRGPRISRFGALIWVNLALVLFLGSSAAGSPWLESWATVFIATVLQALPFLTLGVVISAAITAFVPGAALARVVPRRSRFSVPLAAAAGAALPGCECSGPPIARRLVDRGVEPAAALTFLLAAPAINPVVLVATAVAFPGHPEIVVARLVASLLAAITIGLIWSRWAGHKWLPARPEGERTEPAVHTFVATATGDFVQAGGFLVVGAALVATLQAIVPPSALDRFGGSGLAAVVTMGLLAVLLSVCSEADAFIAAGLTQFSLTARLAFMVVGPMIDVKLFTLQVAVFGRKLAVRFAPLTFVVALLASIVVGKALL